MPLPFRWHKISPNNYVLFDHNRNQVGKVHRYCGTGMWYGFEQRIGWLEFNGFDVRKVRREVMELALNSMEEAAVEALS